MFSINNTLGNNSILKNQNKHFCSGGSVKNIFLKPSAGKHSSATRSGLIVRIGAARSFAPPSLMPSFHFSDTLRMSALLCN